MPSKNMTLQYIPEIAYKNSCNKYVETAKELKSLFYIVCDYSLRHHQRNPNPKYHMDYDFAQKQNSL